MTFAKEETICTNSVNNANIKKSQPLLKAIKLNLLNEFVYGYRNPKSATVALIFEKVKSSVI